MNNLLRAMISVCIICWVCAIAAALSGIEPDRPVVWLVAGLIALYSLSLDAGLRLPRLIWQSPQLFGNAGLFLKFGDRRWRLVRIIVK
jgi:hypothetical protein